MLKGASLQPSSETSKQTRQRHARMSQRLFGSERMGVKSMMLNDIDMHNEEHKLSCLLLHSVETSSEARLSD